LWSSQGEAFVQKYQKRMSKKQRKKIGKKQTRSNDDMMLLSQDVVRLLELAVFQLEPETSAFDSFLKATITKDFLSLPLNFIWDSFEKENPFMISKTTVLSPLRLKSKKRKQQSEIQDPTKTKNSQQPQARQAILSFDKENIDSLSIPISVPLIAPRKKTKGVNSLLGAPKSYFVGSHFNTNLANAQSLFRQVTVPKQRPTTSSDNALRTKCKQTKQQKSVLSSTVVPPTPGMPPHRIPPVVPETPHPPAVKRSSMMVIGNNSMPPPPPRTASQVVAEALSSLQRREQRRHRMH
jgi:hypothetical protein